MDIFSIQIRQRSIIEGWQLLERTTNKVGQEFKILNMNGEDLDLLQWKDNPGYFVGAIIQIVQVNGIPELLMRSENCHSAGWIHIHECSEWTLEIL